MKVDKFDFAVPDLMALRKDFTKYINELLEELDAAYKDFCLYRDNGMIEDIDVSTVLVPFTAISEVIAFLALHKILKKHAYERVVSFLDLVIADLEEFRNLYGGI